MPRNCSVCARADADAVNVMLAAGRSARSVALGLGIADDAVLRHRRGHVPPPLSPAARAAVMRALEPFPDALAAVSDALASSRGRP